MATLFVDKVDPQSGTNLEIGSSGDTIALGSGVTQTIAVNTPAFSAYGAGANLSNATDTKLTFGNTYYNVGSGYDTSTSRFTV